MYDIIKRQNGEAFAKAILHYDASLFEIEDLPRVVKFAGRNALPILGTLKQIKEGPFSNDKKGLKSPYELLAEAGYDAFYVDTLEKQNSIRHYFHQDEELCTFNDEHRFENYYIIHAVKHNAHLLKRKNFAHPDRQDEYGTSVISIQLLKRGGLIKITNRYNHQVENQDSTFDNNPDNIIEGLSYALRDYFIEEVEKLDGVSVNGKKDHDSAPHIVSVSIEGVRAEVILHTLEDRNIYVSAGSACASNKPAISSTLQSIGLKKELLDSTIRFSFSVHTTKEELDYALLIMAETIPMLQRYTRK